MSYLYLFVLEFYSFLCFMTLEFTWDVILPAVSFYLVYYSMYNDVRIDKNFAFNSYFACYEQHDVIRSGDIFVGGCLSRA